MPGYNDVIDPAQAAQPNFQQAGAYQQTLTPVQPPQQAAPPANPQELEQRKSGWMDFITKIRDDPALRNSILMGASQLMKGPQMGQTQAGALGQALQLGTTAHGFYQGNEVERQQAQQRLEQQQQQVAQQGRLADSNIEQNTAQTSGLQQQQQFEREGQAYKQREAAAKAEGAEFTASKLPGSYEQELLDKAAARKLKEKQGTYYEQVGASRAAAGGPKTPAGVALLREQKELIKSTMPMQEDENPLDYEARVNAEVLKYTQRPQGGGNPNAVKVQALQVLMRDMDPKDPAYAGLQQQLTTLGGITEGGPAAEITPTQKAEWEKVRQSVPVGEKYTLPNGKTYTRVN